jgi:hypothetical protein
MRTARLTCGYGAFLRGFPEQVVAAMEGKPDTDTDADGVDGGADADGVDGGADADGELNDPLTQTDVEAPRAEFEGGTPE